MNSKKKGASGVLIVVGITLLLLGVAAYTMAFSRLNFVKARLDSAAHSIAAVGSLNILSPSTVCESMRDTFLGLFPDGGASLGLAADSELLLNLYFYTGINGSGGQSAAYTVPKSGACNLTGLYKLPLQKIKVELAADVRIDTFAPVEHFFGATKSAATMSAEAFAQLDPLDVVLLIDNSNSVISPIDSTDSDDSNGFDEYTGGVGTGGADSLSKKALYTAACFGHVNKRLKAAAVKLYDVLTAVSTNRVGVAYTNPGWGEVIGLAVGLDQSPWTRNTGLEADNGKRLEYVPSPPGAVDNYSSRCASITDDYNLPDYPFDSAFVSVSGFLTADGSLTDKLVCRGGCDDEDDYNRFDPEASGLLPREIIWSANAGLLLNNLTFNPAGNVNILEPVLKKIYAELALNNRVVDDPELPGQKIAVRKLVIYLTDGVDVVPNSTVLPVGNPIRPDKITTLSPTVSDGSIFFPSASSISQITKPVASPTPPWAGMQENPCAVPAPDNSDYAIGVLYLHHRVEDADAVADLPGLFKSSFYMPGHTYEDEDLLTPNALMATLRTGCKSSAGPAQGSFFVESSSFSDDADVFVKEIVPAVLRSVMLPSLR